MKFNVKKNQSFILNEFYRARFLTMTLSTCIMMNHLKSDRYYRSFCFL